MTILPDVARARRAPSGRPMRRLGRRRRGRFFGAQRRVAALAILLPSLSCQPAVTPPDPGSAALQLVASSVPGTVTTLVVEVTAADIPAPKIFTIAVSGGTASGTITVPVGPARTVNVRAYNAAGIESHRGAATVRVLPEANPPLSISLNALQGQQVIQIRVESLVITVTPAALALRVDQTASLQAPVMTATGDPVSVTPAAIHWATLQPHVATVGTSGEVLGVSPGSARIVAVYAGVTGAAAITVIPAAALQTSGDLMSCPTGAHRLDRRTPPLNTKPNRRKPPCTAA